MYQRCTFSPATQVIFRFRISLKIGMSLHQWCIWIINCIDFFFISYLDFCMIVTFSISRVFSPICIELCESKTNDNFLRRLAFLVGLTLLYYSLQFRGLAISDQFLSTWKYFWQYLCWLWFQLLIVLVLKNTIIFKEVQRLTLFVRKCKYISWRQL